MKSFLKRNSALFSVLALYCSLSKEQTSRLTKFLKKNNGYSPSRFAAEVNPNARKLEHPRYTEESVAQTDKGLENEQLSLLKCAVFPGTLMFILAAIYTEGLKPIEQWMYAKPLLEIPAITMVLLVSAFVFPLINCNLSVRTGIFAAISILSASTVLYFPDKAVFYLIVYGYVIWRSLLLARSYSERDRKIGSAKTPKRAVSVVRPLLLSLSRS